MNPLSPLSFAPEGRPHSIWRNWISLAGASVAASRQVAGLFGADCHHESNQE